MPRYYFHLVDGRRDQDTDGIELPDLQTARGEAVRFAAETIRDRPDWVWDGNGLRIEVTDGDGMLFCMVVILGIDAPAGQNLEGA